ncbi:hypothetical protein [Neptunomonas qingdaonensis]|uniref:Glycosyl transferases group 1 n=1 Tax=Neptunomonas qingdaonensis TaxID=1045558 RepID=A0A1I2N0U6_9GAMM|nr:hypothetical protein [Neptunomonas qingdaonensis]SFF95001.1 hypothetical protein SAMN05216175_10295 [Neptunomonas qingdaonensis]
MNVLYIEKKMSKASPLISLSQDLIKLGAKVSFIDFSELSTKELISHFLKADVVVLQHYGKLGDYDKRQLAIAPLLGTPLIRNWAGTDVLNVIKSDIVKRDAQVINKFVSFNVTDSHKGLVEELSTANILCDSLPKIIYNLNLQANIPKHISSRTILAYLPAERRNFYGAQIIKGLIEKFHDVKFSIIGDDEHYFSHFENVISHGWVTSTEMESIWDNVGILIRITEHDGTPRMIYEALSRGKYVIHNNKNLEAIWYAGTQNEVEQQVERFLALQNTNTEGLEFINKHFESKPNTVHFSYLSNAKVSFKTRLASVKFILQSLFS